MNFPPKIAIATGGLQFGGTTTFLLNLADGLQTLGTPSAVFSLTETNPMQLEFASRGIPVRTFDERRLIFEDRLSALYREIADFAPDALIANIGADAYETLRYVPRGVVRIGMIHDLAMQPQHLLPLYQDVLDGVAVVNSHLVKVVEQAVPKTTCRYLSHGIPLPEETLAREANLEGPLRIIYFGRFYEGKGTRIFPSIIDELHQRQIAFRWTFHGTGPEEQFLRTRLAAEIASGEVAISTALPREKLFPLVRQHDIFIMASEIEGGPLTLLEAMALGLVPVCNDIPCLVQEVIHPGNGFCIPREPARYAESIAFLDQNRSQLEQMSAAARKTINAFHSTKAMAERYLQFIKSLSQSSTKIAWPARIRPKPIRGSNLSTMSQSISLVRQARRLLKRLNTKHLDS